MALTLDLHEDRSTAGKRFVIGDRRLVLAEVTFDSSYPTGGEAVTAADFGLDTQIDTVIPSQPVTPGKKVAYDHENSKLVVYAEDATSGVHAEAASASDQSTLSVRVTVIGK